MAATIRGSSGPLASLQPPHPFTKFPTEILHEIFIYFEQQDYLTGMETCTAWYNFFPKQAQRSLTSIQLYPRDLRNSKRRDLCLGKHVKTVAFKAFNEESRLFNMMDKLFDWGCTEVESLEFIGCTARNQTRFLSYLQQLSPSLIRLTMIEHNANIAFRHIFRMCTKLTHFTYNPSTDAYTACDVYDQEPAVDEPFAPVQLENSRYPSIIYLCLDTIVNRELRLEPILSGCPNLQYLIGASSTTIGKIAGLGPPSMLRCNTAVVDLDTLFKWCPRISTLENNWHSDLWACRIYRDGFEGQTGLRHFGLCETDDYSRDQIAQHLMRHQDTLEHFAVSQHTDDDDTGWSRVFVSLHLNKLRTLILHQICADVSSIVTMINHSRLLESLTLRGMRITIESTAVQSLDPMDKLCTLELAGVKLGDMDSVAALLERFPVLERLTIDQVPVVRGSVRVDLLLLAMKPYSTHLKYLKIAGMYAENNNNGIGDAAAGYSDANYDDSHIFRIETIILEGMSMISYETLQLLAGIKSLRCLNVELDQVACRNDSETNFHHFAWTLLQTKTPIEELALSHIWRVPDDVLSIFAGLPKLTQLTMSGSLRKNDNQDGPAHISGLKLLQLLSRSKSLRHITVRQMKKSAISSVKAYIDEIRTLIRDDSKWIMDGRDCISNQTGEMDSFWLEAQALHSCIQFTRF